MGLVPTQYWLGKRFRQTLAMLEQAQHWDAAQYEAYQLDRLREMTLLAYDKTAFYRRIFDDAGFDPRQLTDPRQLSVLPTTNSQTVRENLSDMCTVDPQSPGVDMVSTGGTSNAPLQFYINSDRSAVEYAYLISGWRRAGYDVNTPMAVFRGRVVPFNKSLGFRYEYDPILRHHYYSNFHMSDENMGRYLDHVSRQGSLYLHVYPSSATALARFIRRSGRESPTNVRGIIAESEIVYPEQRELIEKTFACRLFSSYGMSEKLLAAAGCEHSNFAHVWPTYGYFELLDDKGDPITTPGQRGEIVGTGFINRIVPFIRYRTGDMATLVGLRCEHCGRQHPIIKDIRGHRTQEMLVLAGGAQVSWTAMNMHDDTFANVRQFQFFQDTPGKAILKIVPADAFTPADRDRMVANLTAKFDGQIEFSVQKVDRINLTSRAKAVYVDQHIASAVVSVDSDSEPITSP